MDSKHLRWRGSEDFTICDLEIAGEKTEQLLISVNLPTIVSRQAKMDDMAIICDKKTPVCAKCKRRSLDRWAEAVFAFLDHYGIDDGMDSQAAWMADCSMQFR